MTAQLYCEKPIDDFDYDRDLVLTKTTSPGTVNDRYSGDRFSGNDGFSGTKLECRASTNLLDFEMIGSWPTSCRKKRRKRYICRARPDQILAPSANNRSFPFILHCPFVEQEPIFSIYIKRIAIFENLTSQKDYASNNG